MPEALFHLLFLRFVVSLMSYVLYGFYERFSLFYARIFVDYERILISMSGFLSTISIYVISMSESTLFLTIKASGKCQKLIFTYYFCVLLLRLMSYVLEGFYERFFVVLCADLCRLRANSNFYERILVDYQRFCHFYERIYLFSNKKSFWQMPEALFHFLFLRFVAASI